MDPQVQSSFIPKKSLTSEGHGRAGMFSLIFLVSLLMFVASLAAAGAVFAYNQYLTTQLASKSDSLEKTRSAYDPAVIEDLIRLDRRISEAKKLLGTHVSPSAIFTFLSLQTLERVQFTDFSYVLGDGGAAAVDMKGRADSFSSVALQADQFGASKVMRDVVFSDIAVDADTGNVTFSVTATIDSSYILYNKNYTGSTTVQPSTTEAPTPETSP